MARSTSQASKTATKVAAKRRLATPTIQRLPRRRDVLCGRGKDIQNWPGNVNMRRVLRSYLGRYREVGNANNGVKGGIVREAAEEIRRGGKDGEVRILKKMDGIWVDASDQTIKSKFLHFFRDNKNHDETEAAAAPDEPDDTDIVDRSANDIDMDMDGNPCVNPQDEAVDSNGSTLAVFARHEEGGPVRDANSDGAEESPFFCFDNDEVLGNDEALGNDEVLGNDSVLDDMLLREGGAHPDAHELWPANPPPADDGMPLPIPEDPLYLDSTSRALLSAWLRSEPP